MRSSSSPSTSHQATGFSLDLQAIKNRARAHIEEGAVTQAQQGDRQTILKLLNDALATELVCVLRYRFHAVMSPSVGGIAGFAVSDELKEHAEEEQTHADWLAERIVQLGGVPEFDPSKITARSHTEYKVSENLRGMLTEDLVAERIAIETYADIIRYVGDSDSTTRRIFEAILAQEEEHADELADFLKRLPINS